MAEIGFQEIKRSPELGALALKALEQASSEREKPFTSLREVFNNFEERKKKKVLSESVAESLRNPKEIGNIAANVARAGLLPDYAEAMTKMEDLTKLRQDILFARSQEQREQEQHNLSQREGETTLKHLEEKHPLEMESMRTESGLRRAQTEGAEANTEATRTDTGIAQYGHEQEVKKGIEQETIKQVNNELMSAVAQKAKENNISEEDALLTYRDYLAGQGISFEQLAPYNPYAQAVVEREKASTSAYAKGLEKRAEKSAELEAKTDFFRTRGYGPGDNYEGKTIVLAGSNGEMADVTPPNYDSSARFIRNQLNIEKILPGLNKKDPSWKGLWMNKSLGSWSTDPNNEDVDPNEKLIYDKIHELRHHATDEVLTNQIQDAFKSGYEVNTVGDFLDLLDNVRVEIKEGKDLQAIAQGHQRIANPERDTSMPVSP